jgi:hypothetical protein
VRGRPGHRAIAFAPPPPPEGDPDDRRGRSAPVIADGG